MTQSKVINMEKIGGAEITLYRLELTEYGEKIDTSYGLLIKTRNGRDAVPIPNYRVDGLKRLFDK